MAPRVNGCKCVGRNTARNTGEMPWYRTHRLATVTSYFLDVESREHV